MKDDKIRRRVMEELEYDPSVRPADIGVSVENGIVTLSGHVATYAEKLAAEAAARRVRGVRGIAEEIEVRYPEEKKQADDEIAERALKIIAWYTTVPDDAIQVKVEKGMVTLTGDVQWQYQKIAAEDAVHRLSGVMAVVNNIKVTQPIETADVQGRIEGAFQRNAEIEAGNIQVRVEGKKVILNGRVHSWTERVAAERAAWSALGVEAVENHLTLG